MHPVAQQQRTVRLDQGFGFTLRGPTDFNLHKFNSNAPPHSFRAYYGVDGTGDITKTANMRDFAARVWAEVSLRRARMTRLADAVRAARRRRGDSTW